ncbi:hypothetical protein BGX26_003912 [Mortierella sp. AD094]|nr:hypothetical protein BGX26_003912 [Mortierella sp. AD094]
MVHPLGIPEITALVGSFLDLKEIFGCVLVCKTWKDFFTPLLYHSCSILHVEAINPTLETLNNYANYIRVLYYAGPIDFRYYSVLCSRLTSLVIDCGRNQRQQHLELLPIVPDLIQRNNSTLQHFTQHHRVVPSSAALWNALAQCKRLKTITLYQNRIPLQDLRSFWKACSAVEELTLKGMGFLDNNNISLAEFLPGEFPKLKILTIDSIEKFDSQVHLEVIKRATNLNVLDWNPNIQNFPRDIFRQVMSNSQFRRLQCLRTSRVYWDDQEVAMMLNAMTKARIIQILWSCFSEDSYWSLKSNHAATIQSLEIRDSSAMTFAMAQGILSGCPSLESLTLGTIRRSDLARGKVNDLGNVGGTATAETVVLGEDWVCLKLMYWEIYFGFSALGTEIDLSTAEGMRQQQLEWEHALKQLSRLTELRTLKIDYNKYDNKEQSLALKMKSCELELSKLARISACRSI